MEVKIDDLKINYIQYGKGSDILLLHGWGQIIEMMKILGDHFENNHRITILDFPGFGKSDEPKTPWSVEDYSLLVGKLVKKLKIKNPIIIGHSFGGRVAIKYSSMNEVNKLVLFGAPCIREQKELPLKVKILKSLKKLPGLNELGEYMKRYIGSDDYRNSPPALKQSMVKLLNDDMRDLLPNIKVPTLLLWGENDTATPIEDAELMEKTIPDAGLVRVPGCSHYVFLEQPVYINNIIKTFLTGGK